MLPVTPQACGSGRPASNGRLRSGAPVLCLLSYVRVQHARLDSNQRPLPSQSSAHPLSYGRSNKEPPAGVEPAPRPYKGRVLAVDTTEARWRRWESNPRLLRCKRSGLPQASPAMMRTGGVEPPQREAAALQAGELAGAQRSHEMGRPAGIEPALRASQARMLAVTSRPPRVGGDDRARTGGLSVDNRLLFSSELRPLGVARVGFEPTVSSS
jgi:hypothetical protein